MISQDIRDSLDQIFGSPEAFAEMLNVFLYKEDRILPEMVKECSQELYAIVDEQTHFSERLAVIKLVNDGKKEDVVIIEFIQGSDKVMIWSHPNNFIN